MFTAYAGLFSLPLFSGIREDELPEILEALDCRSQKYDKGEILLLEGDSAFSLGVLVTGSLLLFRDDIDGNRNVLACLDAPAVFTDPFSDSVATYPLSSMALSDCRVLFLSKDRILSSGPSSLPVRFYQNLIRDLSDFRIRLLEKIESSQKKNTQEKILSYLIRVSREKNDSRFEIPLSRQALADYLGVERAAMCTELGKLRDKKIIRYSKNRFELLIPHLHESSSPGGRRR